MSKRTSHIMSKKKQVTCSVQDDKSYVMSNMTLKIIFISQFFIVPICTFLIIWFKAGCLVLTVLQSAHIGAFQSVWQTHTSSELFHVQLQASKSRTAWGTGCSSIQCSECSTNCSTPSSFSIFHPRPTGLGTFGSCSRQRLHIAAW